jgi:ATP-binding cassette, subfamily A (ABC1), member 3
MQYSNGLSSPLGLWLGHLAFDSMFAILTSTIITLVLATVKPASVEFQALGLLVRLMPISNLQYPLRFSQWFVMTLYLITSTLFAYCWTLIIKAPLACFAAVTGYQILIFGASTTGFCAPLSHPLSVLYYRIHPYNDLLRLFPSGSDPSSNPFYIVPNFPDP